MTTIYRSAATEDFPQLVQMGRSMVMESETYDSIPFDDNVFILTMSLLLDKHFLHVAEKDGKVIGCIGGFLTPYLFSREMRATEAFFYVSPENRGGSTAYRLFLAFMAWAKWCKVVQVFAGMSAALITDAALSKLYESFGLQKVGGLFVLREWT